MYCVLCVGCCYLCVECLWLCVVSCVLFDFGGVCYIGLRSVLCVVGVVCYFL